MDAEGNFVAMYGRKLCNREDAFVEVGYDKDFLKVHEPLDA